MGFVHGLFYISFKIWKGLLAFSSFFTEYQSNFWSQQPVMSSMDLPMSVLGADGSPIWELRISKFSTSRDKIFFGSIFWSLAVILLEFYFNASGANNLENVL